MTDTLYNELHCGDMWLALHELLTLTGSIITRVRNGHLLMWKCASAVEPFVKLSIRSGKAGFPDYEEEKGSAAYKGLYSGPHFSLLCLFLQAQIQSLQS